MSNSHACSLCKKPIEMGSGCMPCFMAYEAYAEQICSYYDIERTGL